LVEPNYYDGVSKLKLAFGRNSKCEFRISLKFCILDFVPGLGYPWNVV